MTVLEHITSIVLAAGKGTRMKSELPKVATVLSGKPLLSHVLDNLEQAGIQNKIVVIGYKKEVVQNIASSFSQVEFAEQTEQLGTGHAVLCAESKLDASTVLVACGDAPLITGDSFRKLIDLHKKSGSEATILTAILENPFGYGRIVRSKEDGSVLKIVEEKDATPEEKQVQEINTGTYVFNARLLFEALHSVGNDNSQKEYYLTDVIKALRNKNLKVSALPLENPLESHGINSPDDLLRAEEMLKNRMVGV